MPDRAPSPDPGDLTVGRLAALAGITVRTLHHYDAIGLLTPGSRTASGYRVYTQADVERLQRILFYRELELPLDRIHALVDDAGSGALDHLRRQYRELGERIERLQRVRAAVETTMEAHQMSIDLTPAERLEVFGDHDPAQHEEEVRDRWGHTDAYRESHARTRRYQQADWVAAKAEGDAVSAAFADALLAGEPPTSTRAMDVAERARLQIHERFYDLSHAMHRDLATMYVEDARFTATYEAVAEGLAAYVHAAINANADRHAAGGAAGSRAAR